MSSSELIERDAETAALGTLLDGARAGRGGTALVAGPPGAGKSRLLAAAREAAAEAEMRVLSARGSELEQSYAFGVARQLLPGRLHEASADLGATVHALHWRLVDLAHDQPLLVVVDDAQWADEASLRLVGYLARRIADEPLALVVAERRAERPGPADAVLAGAAPALLRPAPLSEQGVAAALEAALGERPGGGFVRACMERTGGNPFLVAELAGHLRASGLAPRDDGAAAVREMLPEGVADAIGRRVEALDPAARAMADALAVLGDDTEPGLAAALAGVDTRDAGGAAISLARADLIEDAQPLRFRHPLIHDAVLAGAPALARADAHARAARLRADRGAAPGLVAAHLLEAPAGAGDPWIVEALGAAADEARVAGAFDQSAAYLRRALREPPPADRRQALLRTLGADGLEAQHPEAAAHLEEALAAEADPARAAGIALQLAMQRYYAGRHDDAVDGLLRAIDAADGEDLREDRLRLEAFLGLAGRYDLATEERTRGRVQRLAETLGEETTGERLVHSIAALEAPGPTAAGLAAAARLSEEVGAERPWPDVNEGAGNVAMYLFAGRPDLAGALAERLAETARRTGSPARHAMALACRGAVELDRGELEAAVADLSESLERFTELEPEAGPIPPTLGWLLLVIADAGPTARGEELLRRHELDGELAPRMLLNPLLHGRGMLRLAQGRWADAARDLEELGARQSRWGMTRPCPPWRSAAAMARLAMGERERARALAEEELALARVWDTPRAVATAARAVALIEGGEAAIDGLREAAALLEGTPWRLERARLGVDTGGALRRAGRRREARATLVAAMDEAHACGAGLLAERAAAELRTSGARPRRHATSGADALTPGERRVAALAAEGLTNREIARHLFVSAATVETHLSRAYRKLGIAGRPGLGGALGVVAGERSGSGP